MTNRRSSQPRFAPAASRRTMLKAGAGAAIASGALPLAARPSRAQDAQVTVNFWNWWDVGRQPLMDEIIAGFQEEFPNITVNNVPQTWDRRDELVVTALAGGEPPEILMASRQEIVKFADEKPKCPVQMHFGESDTSIPMSDVEIIKQKRPDCEIYTYPAGHGFYCDERASFHDASAKLAWERTLAFLDKHMK